MIKRIMLYVSMTCLIVFGQSAFANPFFIITPTGTPATISIILCLNGQGSLSCQNYTVSALTLSIKTNVPNHTYPAAGIKIKTAGYTVTGCTPNKQGYCLFSVSDTAPKTISITPSGLSAIAYVTNFPNGCIDPYGCANYSVSICPVSQDGSSFGTCSTSLALDNTSTSTLNEPFAIAINPAQTKVYIANSVPLTGSNACPSSEYSIAICPINSDGSLGVCTSACDSTFNLLTGVAFSPDGNTLYASNYQGGSFSGSVSICSVNEDGSLQPCSTSNGPGTTGESGINFGNSLYVGIQQASNGNTYLYANAQTNQETTAAICQASGSTIDSCNSTYGQTTYIANVNGISFNLAGNIAYLANTQESPPNVSGVSICPLDTAGMISSCTLYTDPTFQFANYTTGAGNNGVGLFMSSPTGFGYIPNNADPNNTVSICKISQTDGSISGCRTAGDNTFNGPNAIALKIF